VFYHIAGIVTDILPNLAVIDCNGVGYALAATTTTLSHLRVGEKAKLYTYSYIREDCFELFGFYSLMEKRCFELLIGISGVGPKAALSMLSVGTPESFASAIINGDEKALTVAQGIGKRTAQRVILELKDKIAKESSGMELPGLTVPQPGAVSDGGKLSDAASALTVLGYSSTEINTALRGIDVETLSLEEIIRLSLKNMLK
jgi:Holliday junction DNA helicase RuvA